MEITFSQSRVFDTIRVKKKTFSSTLNLDVLRFPCIAYNAFLESCLIFLTNTTRG